MKSKEEVIFEELEEKLIDAIYDDFEKIVREHYECCRRI